MPRVPSLRTMPLLILGALAAVMLGPAPAPAVDDRALSLRIDPGFAWADLTPAERHWYDLTWAHSEGSAATVAARALYDDLYTYGRSLGEFNAALLMGLRATGDRTYLDRVMVITDSMRTTLRDADDACVGGTRDGFLNWRWRAINAGSYSCTNTGGYYGSDHHQLDEAMTHGSLALVACAFTVNADLDTAYAARAAFWTGYLLDHWQAKWIQRAGGDSVKAWMDNAGGMYKREAHSVANLMRAAYYLWRITGNPFYKHRADDLWARATSNCVNNPTVPSAYSWYHQVGNPITWQAVNYAAYTSGVYLDLHFDGYAPYAENDEIARFMSTWRDIVFRDSAPAFAWTSPDVFGGGTPVAATASGVSAFARWDSTGRLLAYAAALSAEAPGAPSIYVVRTTAGAQAAVSARGGAPNTPPTRVTDLAASQVGDTLVVLGWTAPRDGGPDTRAASYELRCASGPLTDANFATGTVVPLTQPPKAGGGREEVAVGGLAPGATHHFALRAFDAEGLGSLVSNSLQVTTRAADALPPASIRDLRNGGE